MAQNLYRLIHYANIAKVPFGNGGGGGADLKGKDILSAVISYFEDASLRPLFWSFVLIDHLHAPGIGKDERPWRLKAAIAHSWHAHPGSIKAVAVGDGERTVFTAGFGAKMKGLVKQWKLSTTQCVMDYTGHEEVSAT